MLNGFFICALAKNAETAATQLAAAATSPAIAETQAGASVATLSITRFIPEAQRAHVYLRACRDEWLSSILASSEAPLVKS
jgi:hypothetical protein